MKFNKLALKREIMQVGQKLTGRSFDRDADIEYNATTQEAILTYDTITFWADPQEANYIDIKNSGGIVTDKDIRLTTMPDVSLTESDLVFYNGGTYEVIRTSPKKNRNFIFIRNKDD